MAHFATTLAYLGPPGTFAEEALLSESALKGCVISPRSSILEVIEAVDNAEVALGFVPIENAIDGVVRDTLDTLIFDTDLLIQREVVLDVHLHLMAPKGVAMKEIQKVISYPVALAQCRKFFAQRLPGVELVAATSTADAARLLGENADPHTGALGTALAAQLYGLEIVERDVEDFSGNQTRFVVLSKSGLTAPTGHDRTSIVCFQDADRPGNLHAILGQFAARGINLTRLESRPTKQGLGAYCFAIDLDGHIGDELIADCLKELHATLASVKFLGSYPAAGVAAHFQRKAVDVAWRAANEWVDALRAQIRPSSS